eukprot:8897382-Pyramimonas_sp.AAC.1
MRCAYQLCGSSIARVMFRKSSPRVKMSPNSRSRRSAFWQQYLPDRSEIKTASGNKIKYHGKKY